ncbi:hypothetical protein FISHEDRAFT_69763 [Fistulina hepatica ATCC 64428]|uniref:Uncharacterized protein n=1 Tax=Fistulina hepatica ATCC 64428 TaxID=1128425 RepID=A0A0D7ALR2_9AGAR|nr:hypothetical protein FISHEDRAFT_69763 [Fistulina hepatica ATCC 64428]
MISLFGRNRSLAAAEEITPFVPDGFMTLTLTPPSDLPAAHPSSIASNPTPHVNASTASLPGGYVHVTGPAAPATYGHLAHAGHVVLGLEQVARVVERACAELISRGGMSTPFTFATSAPPGAPPLPFSAAGVRKLVDAFLGTLVIAIGREYDAARQRWEDEARFAGMHDLAVLLRWALARVVRVKTTESVGQQEYRGLLDIDTYIAWRDAERACRYPPTYFREFVEMTMDTRDSGDSSGAGTPPAEFGARPPRSPRLSPSGADALKGTIYTLFNLMSRLTAHAATSGHTPPTLAPLFGPLLFGLGPMGSAGVRQGNPGTPLHQTYQAYLKATSAFEHLMLAFFRMQDADAPSALGVPTRLKDWIKGYPNVLTGFATEGPQGRQKPRTTQRTVRVLSVRRNVRLYSPDLVRSASAWATYRSPDAGPGSMQNNSFAQSREWKRISENGPVQFSEPYRRRMDMTSTCVPDVGYQAPQPIAYGEGKTKNDLTVPSVTTDGSERFSSLADMKWGEFEALGFDFTDSASTGRDSGYGSGLLSPSGVGSLYAPGMLRRGASHPGAYRVSNIDDRLQFDLTESARASRQEKRQTLSWTDFSTAGFSRTDGPLSATLQFSNPLDPMGLGLCNSNNVMDVEREMKARMAEMTKKLKKREKASSHFVSFLASPASQALPPFTWDTTPVIGAEQVLEEAFVDVFCDLLAGGWGVGNTTWADCQWALVEYKSMPQNTLILFEEYVPVEYRHQLAERLDTPRKRLPSLFTSSPGRNSTSHLSPGRGPPTPRKSPSVPSMSPDASKSSKKESRKNREKKEKKEKKARREKEKKDKAVRLTPVPVLEGNEKPNTKAPTPREMEFEGLLSGKGLGETKVISLSQEDQLDSGAMSESTAGSSLTARRIGDGRAASSNGHTSEFGAFPDHVASASATPSRSKGRFRLLSTPKSRTKLGEKPAAYDAVDFEARLTSDSEDEGRGEAGKVEEERWVDILVSSQARRIEGQRYEARVRAPAPAGPRSKPRQQLTEDGEDDLTDPEQASRAVEQALAGVRDRRSIDVDELKIETVPHRERGMPGFSVERGYKFESSEGEDSEDARTPRQASYEDSPEGVDHDEPGAEESPLTKIKARRLQMGSYFAAHPERANLHTVAFPERPSVDSTVDSSGRPSTESYNPSESLSSTGPDEYGRPSFESYNATPMVEDDSEDGSFDPYDVHPSFDDPRARFEVDSEEMGGTASSNGHVNGSSIPAPSTTLRPLPKPAQPSPLSSSYAPQSAPESLKPNSIVGSKTAGLIAMFREKELQTMSTSQDPPPSQIPVLAPAARTAAMAPSPSPPKVVAPMPRVSPPRTSPSESPAPIIIQTPASVSIPPDPVLLNDTGRSSPGRYIHGAPLHNVMEEEEEEA